MDATMTQFSGAVKLGDLNDFINPSQACIVALEGARRPPPGPDLAGAFAARSRRRSARSKIRAPTDPTRPSDPFPDPQRTRTVS